MSKERFDVAVCTKNNESTIRPSLERVLKYATPSRLIVIDGKSTDRTIEIASNLGAEIYSDSGKGLGHARNMALKLANTQLLGFVDADAFIPSNWLELREHLKRPRVAAASATTIYGYGNPPLQRLHEWIARTAKEDAGFVGTIVNRELVLSVGGIREDLPTAEDWELKRRLQARGLKWVWDRSVVILHPMTMRMFLRHFRGWGRGAGKGHTTSRWRVVRSLVISPAHAIRLALEVHPIHLFYYPLMRLWFLIGYLEAG
jgi:glycosyltransferase involved in cell wall biosynthesis